MFHPTIRYVGDFSYEGFLFLLSDGKDLLKVTVNVLDLGKSTCLERKTRQSHMFSIMVTTRMLMAINQLITSSLS